MSDTDKLKFSMQYGSEAHKMRTLSNGKEGSEYARASYAHERDTPKAHLDILAHDKESHVRHHVAQQGHKDHLDKLVNDVDPSVREEVARHGHKDHLDKLMHDPDEYVRGVVAANGAQHHVDKLLHDEHPNVRLHAARRQVKLDAESKKP